MLLQKMQNLKDETKMTCQDIADKSGVPVSTVKRIFSGQTPDPGYTSVRAIVEAMGGSLEEDTEAPQEEVSDEKITAGAENPHEKYESEEIDISEQKKREAAFNQGVNFLCSVYEKSIADKNKLIKALLIIIISMMAIFIFLLIWDLANPNIGFFQ